MNIDISTAWNSIQGMINGFLANLPNILLGILIIFLFYLIGKWVNTIIIRVTKSRNRSPNIGQVLGSLGKWAVFFAGIFIALTVILPSFSGGELIQVLGIGGVAIGFAFRDILQNFLAGILILITEPFKIGDTIVFGSFDGTVEEIKTRATMVRTFDNRRVVIPNAELFTDSVTVNSAYDKRRFQYDVGIGYNDDIDEAKQIILDTVNSVEGVLKDPAADVMVVELDSSSVNLRIRWWIRPGDSNLLLVREQIIGTIKKALDSRGVNIPYPVRTVYFYDETQQNKST